MTTIIKAVKRSIVSLKLARSTPKLISQRACLQASGTMPRPPSRCRGIASARRGAIRPGATDLTVDDATPTDRHGDPAHLGVSFLTDPFAVPPTPLPFTQ
jgi:hypothetical protein